MQADTDSGLRVHILLSGAHLQMYDSRQGTHLHLGGQEQARRRHEKALVPVEGVQHEKLVEENQRRGDCVDRTALAEANNNNNIVCV